jgi:hypothetical protein
MSVKSWAVYIYIYIAPVLPVFPCGSTYVRSLEIDLSIPVHQAILMLKPAYTSSVGKRKGFIGVWGGEA